jgi:structural maintenance of chromosome 1
VINEQLAQTQPKLAEAQQVLAASDARFAALTDTINAADDDVFAAFCARIGVEHIREYRGRQLQVLEREKDARQEFELQMKRLQHTLAFEESEFAKLNARLELNQRVVTKETERMAALTQEKAELQQQIEAIKAEIAELTKRLAELKEEAEEKKVALSNAKKAEAQASKALAASIKEISNWNDAIEKLNSERSSIYRRCRLDEIALPLTQGSLKNVPLEDVSRADSMLCNYADLAA